MKESSLTRCHPMQAVTRWTPSRIEKVEVDANSQKVVVTGYANRNKILKAVRRGGLRADFWSAQNELLHAYAHAGVAYGTFRFSSFNVF
ncbi:hypothetical protein L484_024809 [Morus notabilis]|uniref:HMA domain-containing protein n=1 Tax=Morus notabilis TaxID=981085 RepID=W9R4K3_9ROSA|nr:hypothetical protein L484_024809 [Morus notabilis]